MKLDGGEDTIGGRQRTGAVDEVSKTVGNIVASGLGPGAKGRIAPNTAAVGRFRWEQKAVDRTGQETEQGQVVGELKVVDVDGEKDGARFEPRDPKRQPDNRTEVRNLAEQSPLQELEELDGDLVVHVGIVVGQEGAGLMEHTVAIGLGLLVASWRGLGPAAPPWGLANANHEVVVAHAGSGSVSSPAGFVHFFSLVEAVAPSLSLVLTFVLRVHGFLINPCGRRSAAECGEADVLGSAVPFTSVLLSSVMLFAGWLPRRDMPVLSCLKACDFLLDGLLESEDGWIVQVNHPFDCRKAVLDEIRTRTSLVCLDQGVEQETDSQEMLPVTGEKEELLMLRVELGVEVADIVVGVQFLGLEELEDLMGQLVVALEVRLGHNTAEEDGSIARDFILVWSHPGDHGC